MDLISDLDQKVWVEGNPKESKGYQWVRIATCIPKRLADSTLEYGLFTDNGDLVKARLVGTATPTRDPLRGVGNLKMILHQEGRRNRIIGIIVEDQCVLYTGFKM